MMEIYYTDKKGNKVTAKTGDRVFRVTGTIKQLINYVAPEDMLQPPKAPPIYTKTQFLDKLGDTGILEFLTLLESGDPGAKILNYRIQAAGDTVDCGHQKTIDGLNYLVTTCPSITQEQIDEMLGNE